MQRESLGGEGGGEYGYCLGNWPQVGEGNQGSSPYRKKEKGRQEGGGEKTTFRRKMNKHAQFGRGQGKSVVKRRKKSCQKKKGAEKKSIVKKTEGKETEVRGENKKRKKCSK